MRAVVSKNQEYNRTTMYEEMALEIVPEVSKQQRNHGNRRMSFKVIYIDNFFVTVLYSVKNVVCFFSV